MEGLLLDVLELQSLYLSTHKRVELVQTRSQSFDAGVSEESVLGVLGGRGWGWGVERVRATGPQWELNHRSRHLPACLVAPVRATFKLYLAEGELVCHPTAATTAT